MNVEPVRSDSALPLDAGQKSLLNGTWKFNFVTMTGQNGRLDLSQRPAGFFKPDYDDSAWDTIPVPSTNKSRNHWSANNKLFAAGPVLPFEE